MRCVHIKEVASRRSSAANTNTIPRTIPEEGGPIPLHRDTTRRERFAGVNLSTVSLRPPFGRQHGVVVLEQRLFELWLVVP